MRPAMSRRSRALGSQRPLRMPLLALSLAVAAAFAPRVALASLDPAPHVEMVWTETPPTLDGRLDDAGWKGAADIPLAWEITPGDNAPPHVRTASIHRPAHPPPHARVAETGDRAHLVALQALVAVDPEPVLGEDHHLEGEVGDREADGLRPLERVGGRRDADIGATRDQGRDAVGERRLDIFRLDPEGSEEDLQSEDLM